MAEVGIITMARSACATMFTLLRQPDFAERIKFDLIQASGLVQIKELV